MRWGKQCLKANLFLFSLVFTQIPFILWADETTDVAKLEATAFNKTVSAASAGKRLHIRFSPNGTTDQDLDPLENGVMKGVHTLQTLFLLVTITTIESVQHELRQEVISGKNPNSMEPAHVATVVTRVTDQMFNNGQTWMNILGSSSMGYILEKTEAYKIFEFFLKSPQAKSAFVGFLNRSMFSFLDFMAWDAFGQLWAESQFQLPKEDLAYSIHLGKMLSATFGKNPMERDEEEKRYAQVFQRILENMAKILYDNPGLRERWFYNTFRHRIESGEFFIWLSTMIFQKEFLAATTASGGVITAIAFGIGTAAIVTQLPPILKDMITLDFKGGAYRRNWFRRWVNQKFELQDLRFLDDNLTSWKQTRQKMMDTLFEAYSLSRQKYEETKRDEKLMQATFHAKGGPPNYNAILTEIFDGVGIEKIPDLLGPTVEDPSLFRLFPGQKVPLTWLMYKNQWAMKTYALVLRILDYELSQFYIREEKEMANFLKRNKKKLDKNPEQITRIRQEIDEMFLLSRFCDNFVIGFRLDKETFQVFPEYQINPEKFVQQRQESNWKLLNDYYFFGFDEENTLANWRPLLPILRFFQEQSSLAR